ncbi:PLP-dependent aminotransferase family protein [Nocardia seriolae]|uniref:MocR-like pyridoxine biosynthesis transcription factor PdxR n=1 Tax=Nocardia seriolae TaxID=37332 RepID=UPI00051A2F0A|nr:PLP-dependent aminotransferase family protein [Nocardia seriolae]MTJ63230.1 aminotransferase class I/II-fold pyridoxal phosphate-dependent enzyme [Nocardia seriolae]MTJ72168.1 aminotransferase class I/II-fold pyridoxal phosphate-dependent enzyme [Nocardia seriolae]MTJ88967.1 aminotransferase class I/II-fold pyridoxal phosphate-dependent enzyme [Nocardia seriolae]MTK32947.1 aminotransferase class I/II-fold pyridoxal phosphate-dependent enzyme [Nocardia seriolae]MTK41123.1 aminotransferase cl
MADYWSTLDVDLHLPVDSGTGRRNGLEHALREAIRDGRLSAGTRLPSTRTLAAELGVSRGTVSAAYDQLVAEGHLLAQRGSGTRVAHTAGAVAASRSVDRGPASPVPMRHDLRSGRPDLSRFPTAAWLRASRAALGRATRDAFGYGDPRGRIELRSALAEYLGRTRGVLATPDRIVITTGVQPGLGLLGSVLSASGLPAVAMEDPYIPQFRDAVRRQGATVVPLPVDDAGAQVDRLTTADFDGVGAAVVTPSHQFPIGSTLSPSRRQELARWARAGHLVIEDDYDGEFRYDRQPVGAIQGIAPEDVVYLGSASKTLGPGLRLGWMVLPSRWVGPVTEAKRLADHHSETLGQLTLAEMITSHAYDRHIRSSRLRYRRRRDLLADRLKPRAGRPLTGFALGGIAAGLNALIRLEPAGLTEAEVLTRAGEYGLAIDGLSGMWLASEGRDDRPQGIVVGFASPSDGAYPAALDTLVRTLSWK